MNFKHLESAQKLSGCYYTPEPIAAFLLRWVTCSGARRLLEPSCGDGVFFRALQKMGRSSLNEIVAIERSEDEAQKAARALEKLQTRSSVHAADFLEWAIRAMPQGPSFDAVVGNPPFIRYQYLEPSDQNLAEKIFRMVGLPFTKHTNAWVPFVLAAVRLLKPGGRIAMVLPSELLHVMHAQGLRSYLGETCSRMLVLDPEEIWFEDTLQGAVLLLAEKKTSTSQYSEGVAILRVKGDAFLNDDPSEFFRVATPINGETIEGKWMKALLSSKERDTIAHATQSEYVHSFGRVAKVDVGIVTGANKFFLVPDTVVERYSLNEWAHPMFGRSEHCPGVIYDSNQHEQNRKGGLPSNFLWFRTDANRKLHPKAKEYLAFGESQGLQGRYKCRIRDPWFEVPSVYATEIGMLKRCNDFPRLIHNKKRAFTTDTSYRITPLLGDRAEKLVYCFVNPLTALSAELEGRHYGGGVLELVPSEIEKLLLPIPPGIRPALRRLNGHFLEGVAAPDLLNLQGRIVLSAIGLAPPEIDVLIGAWRKLRDRRHRVDSTELSVDGEPGNQRQSISMINGLPLAVGA